MFARAQIPVSAQDTTASLMAKLSTIGGQLLLEVLPRWAGGVFVPQPQDESRASYSNLIPKDIGEIDWSLSAVDIWRRVRAYHPWPGCYTRWQGRQLKIIQAVPLSAEKTVEAGQVVALDKEEAAFGFGTGDGILGVLRVQMEGKKAMPAAEFLRGQRPLIGAILPSDKK